MLVTPRQLRCGETIGAAASTNITSQVPPITLVEQAATSPTQTRPLCLRKSSKDKTGGNGL